MPVDPAKIVLVAQMSAVAYYAILVWDWLVTIQVEYRLIWKSDWSVYKVLYLISRYWGLITMGYTLWAYNASIDGGICGQLIYSIPAASAIIILSTECILAFRTYAIWQKQTWLLFVIVPLLLGEVVIMILATISVKSVIPRGFKGPCFPLAKGNGKGITFAFWLAPFIVDTIFTSLSIYKAVMLAKLGQASNILSVFIREGIFFFIVVSAVNLLEMAWYLQPVPEMQGLCSFLALSASSLFCCRMVLSLRSSHATGMPPSSNGGRIGTTGAVTVTETELADRSQSKSTGTFADMNTYKTRTWASGDEGAQKGGPLGFLKRTVPALFGGGAGGKYGANNNRKRSSSPSTGLGNGVNGVDGDAGRGSLKIDDNMEGIVVSVDRLEKSDGNLDSVAGIGKGTGARKDADSKIDLEKGLGRPRPSSLYSHEDRSE